MPLCDKNVYTFDLVYCSSCATEGNNCISIGFLLPNQHIIYCLAEKSLSLLEYAIREEKCLWWKNIYDGPKPSPDQLK